jgi:integrase
MATIRRTPTGRWRAQVYLTDGKFRSKTLDTKALARAWAAEAEAKRDAGEAATRIQAAVADNRLTVTDYWSDHVLPSRRVHKAPATVSRNVSHWTNHLAPTFAERPLGAVRRAEVNAWVTERLGSGVGVPTVQACLNLLSAIYAAAIDDELTDTNPATGIRTPAHEPADKAYLSREDVAAILAHVAEPYRTFLELTAATGLRFGEAAGITPEAVLGDARQVRVRKVWTRAGLKDLPKNSSSRRVVPVPSHLRARLAALTLAAPAGWMVFTGPQGGGLSDSNLRQRVLARACDAAGLPRITPHHLRHAYTSWLTEAGVSPFDVAGALGHSSTRMLARYNHLAPGHGDRILAALEGRPAATG